MCAARERESKGQGGTSRQETEEHGMQMYCCDAAVRGNGRESLFLNSLCVAGSLWRVALVDKVSRVKCHKPTQEIVSEWERVRGGIVWLCFEHSVYCHPLQQLWIPSTWSSFTVPAAAIGWAVKDSSSQKLTVCCLLLILVLPFFVFLAYCVEHQDRIAPYRHYKSPDNLHACEVVW